MKADTPSQEGWQPSRIAPPGTLCLAELYLRLVSCSNPGHDPLATAISDGMKYDEEMPIMLFSARAQDSCWGGVGQRTVKRIRR